MLATVSSEPTWVFEAARLLGTALLVLITIALIVFLIFLPFLRYRRKAAYYKESGDLADWILRRSKLLERSLNEPWIGDDLRGRFHVLREKTAACAKMEMKGTSYPSLKRLRRIAKKWLVLSRDFHTAYAPSPK